MKRRPADMMSAPPAAAWSRDGDLWRCPSCGKLYPRAGQGHSCVIVDVAEHFVNRPRAKELFDAFCSALEKAGGPFRLSVAKTRIGIITKVTFAAIMPRKTFLRGHLLLRRRIETQRFHRVERAPNYWIHHFVIYDERDLDSEFLEWLREAWRVGSKTI